MKLIIDIPDKEYNECIERNEWDTLSLGVKLIRAVQNGTRLPKGHGDLIDRDKILQGEHFVVLGNVEVGDKNFGEQEIDMFPKQTIMSVKPIIAADKEKSNESRS